MKLRKSKKLTTKQRDLQESWKQILAKHQIRNADAAMVRALTAEPLREMPVYRRETPYIPSLKITIVKNCFKKEPLQYTGTKMIGIGTLHKSNSIPIFSEEEAIDISRMRR